MDDMPSGSQTEEADHSQRIENIISKGRATSSRRSGTFLVASMTACLLWFAFTPVDYGPIAWIALVPMLMLVRSSDPPRWLYRLIYFVGFLYWLTTLQWMRYGDPLMYFGLLAMAVYLAFYWLAFVWVTRLATTRAKIPLFVAAPIVWTGLEYARAYIVTGFSWYYLGHTQHRWIEMIQVSDLVGVYGVTFLVVLCNTAVAQAIPESWIRSLLFRDAKTDSTGSQSASLISKSVPIAISLVLVISTIAYGYWRRASDAFELGPRVALIQGNFVASLKPDQDRWKEIFDTHRLLTGRSIEYQPDLIVWPEAMFRYPMYEYKQDLSDEDLDEILATEYPHGAFTAQQWKSDDSQAAIARIAENADAAFVVGISIFDASASGVDVFNSAVFAKPVEGIQGRYDKIHRVPFGEYIPLRDQLPFIQSLTPFRGDWGLTAGDTVEVFEYEKWRLLPMICFEDTVPHLVRRMVYSGTKQDGTQVDVLVNLTNDGWFHGSSELDQHLITSKFRAIETRVPLVRAVNTGISAIIDGDGVVREPEHFIDLDAERNKVQPRTSIRDPETGRFHRQLNAALVADVPLDPRTSFYVIYGDWFAAGCLVLTIVFPVYSLFFSRHQRSLDSPSTADPDA